MALYKVGNRYLSEEEYREYCESNWILGLFVAGTVISFLALNLWLPEEWPKYLRFVVVTALSVLSGCILGAFALYICRVVFLAAGVGLLAVAGYWAWLAV